MPTDSELIDELQDGIRKRAATIEAPDDFVAGVRRRARRHSAARAAAIGVPVLAAAAVLAGIVAGPLTSTGRPVHAVDTAYVIRRVEARLATEQGGVQQSSGKGWIDWTYVDSNTGVDYQRDAVTRNGKVAGYSAIVSRSVDHVLHSHATQVNNQGGGNLPAHTWQRWFYAPVQQPTHGLPKPSPGVLSSARQIRQALKSGKVTRAGTTTVHNRPEIELSIAADAPGAKTTLYVDVQTYQPVQEVTTHGAGSYQSRWLPATGANTALAKVQPIPKDYRELPTRHFAG